MKKQILFLSFLAIVIAFVVASCDKKESHSMDLDITMSYTPNPALKDSLITFTFQVMQDGMMTAVTNSFCKVIMGSAQDTIQITEISSGIYSGVHTFMATGTYELHFNFMHSGVASDKDFTCVVQ